MAKETVALYAGSFDPITRGHLDIISKARSTFDRVYVSIGAHPKKQRLFDTTKSLELICGALNDHFGDMHFKGWRTAETYRENGRLECASVDNRVVISSYIGQTLIQHANEIGATHIVRGLRQAGDFNDEFTLAGVGGHLDPNIIFTHFICREEFLHISSSNARELAQYGEDISWLVTPNVEDALLAQNIK